MKKTRKPRTSDQTRRNDKFAENLKASPKGTRKRTRRSLSIAHPHAAGIDIGSREHFVAVPEDRDQPTVRSFSAYTADLETMAGWLKTCGITTVAMESTGIYWLPVYEKLEEAGLEVLLVDARSVKNVPGRKSDVKDCQWIQQLHTYGLLRAAFRPTDAICRLRTLQRHRKNLVEMSGKQTLHIQKAMIELNLQLPLVLSNVVGESGQRILDAILAGQRDPKELAALVHTNVKKSRREIEAALTGNYREETLFVVEQHLTLYRFIQTQIQDCDRHIAEQLAKLPANPAAPPMDPATQRQWDEMVEKGNGKKKKLSKQDEHLRKELARIIGVDLTALPGLAVLAVLTILSEIGTDMSRWRNAKAFASWLGLCPNHRISGGKVLSASSRKVISRTATILRMAAANSDRSETIIGSFYRRKRAQLGPPKAITATARKLACLIYTLMNERQAYENKDVKVYELNFQNARIASLKKQAEAFGYSLTALAQAA